MPTSDPIRAFTVPVLIAVSACCNCISGSPFGLRTSSLPPTAASLFRRSAASLVKNWFWLRIINPTVNGLRDEEEPPVAFTDAVVLLGLLTLLDPHPDVTRATAVPAIQRAVKARIDQDPPNGGHRRR